MLLPGPEAQQLAIYIGWLMNRTADGLMAGALFVLPGFLAIMGLSIIYTLFGSLGPVAALFFGLKAAVLVVVVQAAVAALVVDHIIFQQVMLLHLMVVPVEVL